MAKKYLEKLSSLLRQTLPHGFKDVKLDCKHFFSGAAIYANGKIFITSEKEDALSYYLKAVAAARTSSNQAVIDNLKTAIGKDASLKAKAKIDLEFLKMRENSDFKSLTN